MIKQLFILSAFTFFCNSAFAEIVSLDYLDVIVSALGNASTKDVGVANGVASLDGNVKIPISQIPTGTSGTTVALGNDSRIVNSVGITGSYVMSGTYTITGTLNVPTPPLPNVN